MGNFLMDAVNTMRLQQQVMAEQLPSFPTPNDHADPEMDTEELACIAELQLAKMAASFGERWYLPIGDVTCLVRRAREQEATIIALKSLLAGRT